MKKKVAELNFTLSYQISNTEINNKECIHFPIDINPRKLMVQKRSDKEIITSCKILSSA